MIVLQDTNLFQLLILNMSMLKGVRHGIRMMKCLVTQYKMDNHVVRLIADLLSAKIYRDPYRFIPGTGPFPGVNWKEVVKEVLEIKSRL